MIKGADGVFGANDIEVETIRVTCTWPKHLIEALDEERKRLALSRGDHLKMLFAGRTQGVTASIGRFPTYEELCCAAKSTHLIGDKASAAVAASS